MERCQECNGTVMVWRRLRHPWADDGKLHTTLCMSLVCRWRRGWRPESGPVQ